MGDGESSLKKVDGRWRILIKKSGFYVFTYLAIRVKVITRPFTK